MKLYRFSPIENAGQLVKAIEHVHFACFQLCKNFFGHDLPVAGNIGIFCHYDKEYEVLTKLRQKLTEESDSINQKYYKFHEPIVISARGDVPETTYTYLYIRKPDPYRAHVGDVDFVLEEKKYEKLKASLSKGIPIKNARVFERPELDMVELYDPDVDAIAYVSPRNITVKVRTKII